MHTITARQAAIDAVVFSRQLYDVALKGFPADKLATQPPNLPNHALWTIGHLATTYAFFRSVLDGQSTTVPDSYNALFGPGSKPSATPSTYPPLAELIAHLNRTHAELLRVLREMPEADLTKPPAVEFPFSPTRLAAMHMLAWHDGWHQGQLSLTRVALGLPGILSNLNA
ncbi:MAG: hypothetical protein C0513_04630 [Isosphaera sp.]|nr:hypothetical protein [Isosphaera sp.]